MKTIQNQNQNEELRKAVEAIVRELEKSNLYAGSLSIVRVLPPSGTPTNTPAGYPHLIVQEERQEKLLGLIPFKKKEILFFVKEGFYDIENKGRKDMLVRVVSQKAEKIVHQSLKEYGDKNKVTEIVFNR